jgi:hypothetical protein
MQAIKLETCFISSFQPNFCCPFVFLSSNMICHHHLTHHKQKLGRIVSTLELG